MPRIVIADEQPVTRHAIRILLEKEGFEIAHETGDALDALRAAHELKPDLIITGVQLTHLGGLELVRRLCTREPDIRSLILASQDSEHFVALCREAGAAGFVSKRGDLADVILAARTVLARRTFFPATGNAGGTRGAANQTEIEQIRSLSPREMSVLYYLASGYTNRQIADELLLSDRTVSTYKVRLFRKLHLDNLMELAELARRNNLTGPGHATSGEPAQQWSASASGQDLLRGILDAIPTAVSINDARSRLLFANRYLLDRFERELGAVTGKRLSELNVLDLDEALAIEEVFIDAVQRATSFAREVMINYKSELVAALFWGAPVRNGRGETVAMVCGLQNFTDQEQTFLALREAKERAESASRTRSRLLAGAIDSLRHELSGIGEPDGSTGDRLNGITPSPWMSAIQSIESRLDNIQALIEADAIDGNAVPVHCHIAHVTCDALDIARARQRDTLSFTFDVEKFGPTDVWLDRQRYQQILYGLLMRIGEATRNAPLRIVLRTYARSRALVDIELLFCIASPVTSSHEAAQLHIRLRQIDSALLSGLDAALVTPSAGEADGVLLRMTVAKATSSPEL